MALGEFAQRGCLTLHLSLESDYIANVEKLTSGPVSADGVGPTSVPGLMKGQSEMQLEMSFPLPQ